VPDRSDEILLQLLELRKELGTTVIQQLVKVYETLAPTLEQARQGTLQKLNVIEQTANLTARLALRNKQGPIRCVFMIHMAESWDALAPVYEAMRQTPDFDPIVITIPRILLADDCDWNVEKTHIEMERFGVPHLRFSMNPQGGLDILKALQPDLLFRQQPWDQLIPDAYSTAELNFTRLCYVPYAYMGVQRYAADEDPQAEGSIRQTDMIFHRMCWRIFCETEMHKDMFAKKAARQGKNVVVTGYPKFDQLLQRAKSSPPVWPIPESGGKRRFRIIWAPHHSVAPDWLGFGTFPTMYRDMLNWAREAGDIDFVLKAHPHLWSKVVATYKFMTQEQLDEYLAAWKALPNTGFVEGGDYGPLFAASDLMLTDGISFLWEYPLFEKPLVFIDSGHHCGFNKAGKALLECNNTVTNFAAAHTLCEKLAHGESDPKAGVRKDVLARIVPFPGQSAQKILQAIREGLEQERKTA
jgi:hypothetical protein